MAAQDMPAAEVEVTPALVRSLLTDQHPDLAELPLELVANGWDNVVYRLGAELSVRLPRRRLAAALVEHEQRWLPDLAARLPLPIPAPVRVGKPGRGYPWRWSVCPFFAGELAADVVLADPAAEARRLGEFVAALHVPAPPDAPVNAFGRGQAVGALTPRVEENIQRLGLARSDAVRERWYELTSVPEWGGTPLWVHGDLHTANVLVGDGRLAAVLDFGDMTGGDPAVDLAIGWMLFGPHDRAVFRSATGGLDDATWARAEAWALHFALLYLANSADNPRFARMGEALLAAVLSAELR
jgi:aminoglycoside phosphotransferase (APT) family kinase protein